MKRHRKLVLRAPVSTSARHGASRTSGVIATPVPRPRYLTVELAGCDALNPNSVLVVTLVAVNKETDQADGGSACDIIGAPQVKPSLVSVSVPDISLTAMDRLEIAWCKIGASCNFRLSGKTDDFIQKIEWSSI